MFFLGPTHSDMHAVILKTQPYLLHFLSLGNARIEPKKNAPN